MVRRLGCVKRNASAPVSSSAEEQLLLLWRVTNDNTTGVPCTNNRFFGGDASKRPKEMAMCCPFQNDHTVYLVDSLGATSDFQANQKSRSYAVYHPIIIRYTHLSRRVLKNFELISSFIKDAPNERRSMSAVHAFMK